MTMLWRSLKWVGAVIALGAAAVLLSNLELPPRCTLLKGSVPITIKLSRFARGEAQLFCYRDDAGERIRFILARGTDGAIHSVFDACRQCYSYRKGYRLDPTGSIVCRLCGNRYSLDHMMAGKASCAPVALPHQETGSTIRISAADMRAGRGLF
jgi:uncharacterized membrane protein